MVFLNLVINYCAAYLYLDLLSLLYERWWYKELGR